MGLSTAIWLLRSGRSRDDRRSGIARRPASFGNAGVLAACSVVPVTAPGLIAKAPLLTLDPNSPLFVRWSYLPKLAPWLVRYLSHANAADTARISQGLAELTRDTVCPAHGAVRRHAAPSAGCRVPDTSSPTLHVQRSRPTRSPGSCAARPASLAGARGRGAARIRADARAEDRLGILVPDHGFVLSPAATSPTCARSHVAGAMLLPAEAREFRLDADGAIQAVVTTSGEIEAEAAVIATGAWSKTLTAPLGLDVPLRVRARLSRDAVRSVVEAAAADLGDERQVRRDADGRRRALRRHRRVRRPRSAAAQAADRADPAPGEGGVPDADLDPPRRMARPSPGAERQPAADRRSAAPPRHIPCFWSSSRRADDRAEDRAAAGRPGQRRDARSRT